MDDGQLRALTAVAVAVAAVAVVVAVVAAVTARGWRRTAGHWRQAEQHWRERAGWWTTAHTELGDRHRVLQQTDDRRAAAHTELLAAHADLAHRHRVLEQAHSRQAMALSAARRAECRAQLAVEGMDMATAVLAGQLDTAHRQLDIARGWAVADLHDDLDRIADEEQR